MKPPAPEPVTLPAPPPASPPTILWLIRHAEVEDRYQKVFGGRIDMELSERGHRQAAALAAWLKQQPLDFFYASPMRRVQQTLAPLCYNGLPRPVILPGLQEADFGDWTGLSWQQVREKFGVSAFSWLDQLEQGEIPNAESLLSFRTRVNAALRQILEAHPGRHVGLFCHGGVIRMALAILLDWPLARLAAFEIDYASVSQILIMPHRAVVDLLNFTPWRSSPCA